MVSSTDLKGINCFTLRRNVINKMEISNIPDIRDVNKLIFILGELGVKVEKLSKNTYTFQADEINLDYLESFEFKRDGKEINIEY